MSDDLSSSTIQRFSSDDLPEKDRVEMWREYYCHTVLKVDCEPTEDTLFQARVISRMLPGLGFMSGALSSVRISRTREFIADGNDDFIFLVNRSGVSKVFSLGREVELHPNDAVIVHGNEIVTSKRQTGAAFSLQIPYSILSPLVVNIDDTVVRRIPHNTDALRLLTSYVSTLLDENALETPGLQHLVVNHINDLVALTLGATCDATDIAKERGLRAARLKAAKIYITENSKRPDISIGSVAVHLGVTPRYLQRIFELDGTTFSSFLLSQRLSHAHRMLTEPQFNRQAVGTIAYNVGFNDLSYFNRCFRKFYGLTPKDLREIAAKPSSHAGPFYGKLR